MGGNHGGAEKMYTEFRKPFDRGLVAMPPFRWIYLIEVLLELGQFIHHLLPAAVVGTH